ncbi:MAG: type II toxin-antitoxin system RelE/ParE family toxin [Defluviitaleaceae bacterium]|nr:type II toxin-antitoxin system RelE/ParE family toxin [Defluviitaleaceae bacterium]
MAYEYRKLPVKSYAMFYRVDEREKLVTIARVIYARRNHERLL